MRELPEAASVVISTVAVAKEVVEGTDAVIHYQQLVDRQHAIVQPCSLFVDDDYNVYN